MLDFFAFAKIRINERKVKLTAYFAATCRLSGKIYAASRVPACSMMRWRCEGMAISVLPTAVCWCRSRVASGSV